MHGMVLAADFGVRHRRHRDHAVVRAVLRTAWPDGRRFYA